MKIFVAVWQRTKPRGDHKTGQYFTRCWNCQHESEAVNELATALKLAREHHKHCTKPNAWTQQEMRTLITLVSTEG